VDLNKLSMGDKIAGGAGILLIIGLLFLPWHKIDFGFDIGGVDDSVTRTAIQSPNSFWGILALLLTIAIVVVIVLRKLTTVALPALGSVTWADALFFASIAVAALLLLKLIIETDALGWGLWLDLLFAAGLVYGGFLIKQEGDVATPGTPGTPGPPQSF
jgi:hypothetical protein